MPGGVHTNDLAFPYIVSRISGRLTPCYGGEEYLDSLFHANDLPLPYFPDFHRTIRKKSFSWLSAKALHIASPMGYMRRGYQFLENEIRIATHVWSLFKNRHQYLFFDNVEEAGECMLKGSGYRVVSDKPFYFDRFAYCAIGKLRVYHVESPKSSLTFKFVNEA